MEEEPTLTQRIQIKQLESDILKSKRDIIKSLMEFYLITKSEAAKERIDLIFSSMNI